MSSFVEQIDEIISLAKNLDKLGSEIFETSEKIASAIANLVEKLKIDEYRTYVVYVDGYARYLSGDLIKSIEIEKAIVKIESRNIEITFKSRDNEKVEIDIGRNSAYYDAIRLALNIDVVEKALSEVINEIKKEIRQKERVLENIKELLNKYPEITAHSI